eukprot:1144323-Pelagomonas_calceolata.AAC.2
MAPEGFRQHFLSVKGMCLMRFPLLGSCVVCGWTSISFWAAAPLREQGVISCKAFTYRSSVQPVLTSHLSSCGAKRG